MKLKCLVVEDASFLREIYRYSLMNQNYEIIDEAIDGEQALVKIKLHQPDIVIVPECEHPDKLKFNQDTPAPKSILWYGTNQNKGLGIFSYSNYKLKLLKIHNPDIKFILPIAVCVINGIR